MENHVGNNTPTPEKAVLERIEKSQIFAHVRTRACCDRLRAVRNWVRQFQTPDADADDILRQIEDQVREWYAVSTAEDDPRFVFFNYDAVRREYEQMLAYKARVFLDLCQDLARYPQEAVEATVVHWQQRFARITRSTDALGMLDRDIRRVYRQLDDRTRYLIDAMMYLGAREELDGFSEMEQWFANDIRFRRRKAREYASDPELGCITRALELVETIDASKTA
jgi:hypothetical protein